MIFNFDSDGCIFDFNTNMSAELEAKGHTLDQSKWDFGLTKEQFIPVFATAILKGVFRHGAPITGALWAVQHLQDQGHHVRIVTSKIFPNPELTRIAQVDTLRWYEEQGFEGLEFVFTKGHLKRHYPADVIVDDKPTLDWTQAGATNILFDQPWNRDVKDGNFIRAFNWNAVLRLAEGRMTVV